MIFLELLVELDELSRISPRGMYINGEAHNLKKMVCVEAFSLCRELQKRHRSVCEDHL